MKEVLKRLRKEHDHTQENLAEKLEVSRQTISNWETGRSAPGTESIQRLADIYGSEILSFFSTEVPNNIQYQTTNDIHIERNIENRKTINFFMICLSLLSTLIPFAAIFILYAVFKLKDKMSEDIYKLSFSFLAVMSLINIAGISFLFLHLL